MKNYKTGLMIFLFLATIISLFPPFLCNNDYKIYDFLFLQNRRIVKGENYTFDWKVFKGENFAMDTSDIISKKVIDTGSDTTYTTNYSKKRIVKSGGFNFVVQDEKIDEIKPYRIYSIEKPYWHNQRRELILNELIIEYFLAFIISIIFQLIFSWKRKLSS